MLKLYSIFHLNMAYSSIEEEQCPQVISHCYWPLLRLAREFNLPFGIEATGYTLETIADIDPDWISELRQLTTEGPCEFIGSGYAQIIGPLVPAEVNSANLHLGNQAYERMLGFRPDIALVNEQAYSASLVQHYLDAGYRAIIMEWDNPYRFHPEWDPEWRYLPQIACGQHGEEIPVIWNKAIAFQKFQRYAHGEIEWDKYLEYLCKHLSDKSRSFSLYGNDVEIFNFRPGRFKAEALLQKNEWERIGQVFKTLLADGRFQFIRPSQVLDLMQEPGAGNRLYLESPEQPISVKKQRKYNITRWAVTGRNDLDINTACWRIYEALKARHSGTDNDWRELCYLWSSDFRTHITEKRWRAYRGRLKAFENKIGSVEARRQTFSVASSADDEVVENPVLVPCAQIERNGRFLTVETANVKVRLNCRRGLAVDGLWFKGIIDQPYVGTLHHGYYDDISLGADFYTGHLIFESSGQSKVTDLNPVDPKVEKKAAWIRVSGTVPTELGSVYKSIYIFHELKRMELEYRLDWKLTPIGSLRLGHVTLNPMAFERDTLFYLTHNGGKSAEKFFLSNTNFDHGAPASFLVSASQGIGMSEGMIQLGDAKHSLNVEIDKCTAALIGLITYQQIDNTYFYRLALSMREMDETSRPAVWKVREVTPLIRLSLTIA